MNQIKAMFAVITAFFRKITDFIDEVYDAIEKKLYRRRMEFAGWEDITNEKLSAKIEKEMNPCLASIKLRIDQWGRTWCLTTNEGKI